MHQDRRRLAQTCANSTAHWSKLSQATTNKTVKRIFLALVGPLFHSFYGALCTLLRKRQPAQVQRQRKQATLHLSDISLSWFLRCFTHITQKKPAQVKRQRKSSQVDQHRRKKVKYITAAKLQHRSHGPKSLPTYPHEKP